MMWTDPAEQCACSYVTSHKISRQRYYRGHVTNAWRTVKLCPMKVANKVLTRDPIDITTKMSATVARRGERMPVYVVPYDMLLTIPTKVILRDLYLVSNCDNVSPSQTCLD